VELQEVRYKNVGTKIVKGGDAAYKLYWSGESTGRGGVGLMVHVSLVKKVIDAKHLNSRIIVMELAVENEAITVLSLYASQSGSSIEEKDLFYENLSREMLKVNGKCRSWVTSMNMWIKYKMGTKECMMVLVMYSEM